MVMLLLMIMVRYAITIVNSCGYDVNGDADDHDERLQLPPLQQ